MTPPRHRRADFVAVSLALSGVPAAVSGCRSASSASLVTATTSTKSQPEATKVATIFDADVAQAIERHFKEQGLGRLDFVQVSVTHGIVVLSGSAGDLLAKERAAHLAGTIKGVRAVVDQVTVVPVARTDEEIRSDVASALRLDAATRPCTIGVAVKDGWVTLSGVADSRPQKILFGDVAETVAGVKGIDNAVTVQYAMDRPASEIAADVRHRIANDVWLDGNGLGVAVTGHTVHLVGVVASLAQKVRAQSDGWVAGVVEVDDGGVLVDWYAQNDQRRVSDFPVKSEAEIARAVQDAFRFDPRLKSLAPQVVAQNGTVVLSGTVDSPQARRAAEVDAMDTVGVWSVRDEVLVQPAAQPTDADVDRAARRVLADDVSLSDAQSIRVSAAKGKVALSGTIPSGFERFAAIGDVKSVPGVTEVDDGLDIKRAPAEVKASIEERLFWDPMMEHGRVSVSVTPDGVATLIGTVDSWAQLKAATEDALWGGATHVVNALKLKNHPEVSPH